MCIDIVEIWFGIINRQGLSVLDSYLLVISPYFHFSMITLINFSGFSLNLVRTLILLPASVAQLDVHQAVTGLTPTEVGNILSWRFDHEIFSTVILSLPLIQVGSCQFLAKECAQYWLTV